MGPVVLKCLSGHVRKIYFDFIACWNNLTTSGDALFHEFYAYDVKNTWPSSGDLKRLRKFTNALFGFFHKESERWKEVVKANRKCSQVRVNLKMLANHPRCRQKNADSMWCLIVTTVCAITEISCTLAKHKETCHYRTASEISWNLT